MEESERKENEYIKTLYTYTLNIIIITQKVIRMYSESRSTGNFLILHLL